MSKQFETVARWLDKFHYVEADDGLDDGVGTDDKVDVVRCMDCKRYNEKTYKGVNGWARTLRTCAIFDGYQVQPDGFCAWGERRDA